VESYVVVNEPFDELSVARNCFGADYDDNNYSLLKEFYRAARQADSTAKLILNEFGVIYQGSRSDRYYNMAKALKEGGLIDGVGFQSHGIKKKRAGSMDSVI
jgi:endo-1,4-beta-xylanase